MARLSSIHRLLHQRNRHFLVFSLCSSSSMASLPQTTPFRPPVVHAPPFSTFSAIPNADFSLFSKLLLRSRNFSSEPGSNPAPNIIMVNSGDQLNNSLQKAEDESLPAIFYFTAAWCGPCRFLAPHIENLSKTVPHVNVYKVDIDQEGVEETLNKLNIFSVPTLLFFKNGKKAAEVVGADATKINNMASSLYEKDAPWE